MKSNSSGVLVGALFNPSLDRISGGLASTLDYLAVIPDRMWHDCGRNSAHRFREVPGQRRRVEQAASELPIVLHSVGMSLCSAGIFDRELADNLIEIATRFKSPWMSDHLSFSRVGTGHGTNDEPEREAGGEVNAAFALPVAYDLEMLDILLERVGYFTDRLACPFLLENNVYYVRFPDQEMTEEQFFNRLCEGSACGVLLDLHNLYTNSVNHGFPALDYLDNLDLGNVREIHIAGGSSMMGFHTDSHYGPVHESVWGLLENVIPRAKRLLGVTFEFHESSFAMMGEDGFLEQIERTRAILENSTESATTRSDVSQRISAGAR